MIPNPGEFVVTPGAERVLRKDERFAKEIMARHLSGDWGDIPAKDKHRNDQAAQSGHGMILSVYKSKQGDEVLIITESDRSKTTVLLPRER